jgi:hypothetical protein
MTRTRAVAILASAVAAGAMTPVHAATAAVCQVQFDATFQPGLAGAGNTFQGGAQQQLRIAGTMTCPGQASPTASVSVGTATFTTPATDGTDIANGILEYRWQDPVGTVVGGCLNNHSSADSISRWADGSISIVRYTTDSFTYGIGLQGVGVATSAATAIDPKPGQPAMIQVTATRDVGAAVGALLVAGADSPNGASDAFTACNGAGLTSVRLTGGMTITGA